MELSATYSRALSDQDAVFVYVGLPGEPAFGPPAFMHWMSIMDSLEAPITHHWLIQLHITFGVVTGGFVHGDWKIESSGFSAASPTKKPHRHRAAEIRQGAKVRLSWNHA